MLNPNLIILYVDNPPASMVFYTTLLRKAPVESSPTFSMFVLESGVKLGLWSKHTVEPAAKGTGGGGELAFTVGSIEEVERIYNEWSEQKLFIIQTPTYMDFGYTFMALDPDGHRLRIYTLTSS